MTETRIEVRPVTILAVRSPVDVASLKLLERAAKRNMPPGTDLYIRQQGDWFLFDACKPTKAE